MGKRYNLPPKIREALSKVKDPHTHIDIVRMGLVHCRNNENTLEIIIRPTSPFCPGIMDIISDVVRVMRDVELFKKLRISVENHIFAGYINASVEKGV